MARTAINQKSKSILRGGAAFLGGGTGYCLLELLWRGRTHSSMFMAGGLCLPLLLRISKTRWPFPLKCVAGGLGISAVEFTTGCIVNRGLGLQVWDYSSAKFNVLGQVCLGYTLLWCALSGAVMLSHQAVGKRLSSRRLTQDVYN